MMQQLSFKTLNNHLSNLWFKEKYISSDKIRRLIQADDVTSFLFLKEDNFWMVFSFWKWRTEIDDKLRCSLSLCNLSCVCLNFRYD